MNEITDSTAKEVLEADHGLLYFSADWCGPCKVFGPIMNAVTERHKDRLVAGKVDVDSNPELVAQFKVMAMPTVIMLKNGEEFAQFTGRKTPKDLADIIDGFLDEDE